MKYERIAMWLFLIVGTIGLQHLFVSDLLSLFSGWTLLALGVFAGNLFLGVAGELPGQATESRISPMACLGILMLGPVYAGIYSGVVYGAGPAATWLFDLILLCLCMLTSEVRKAHQPR